MNSTAAAAKGTTSSSKRTLDIQHTNKLCEFQAKAERLAALKQAFNVIHEQLLKLEELKKQGMISREDLNELVSLHEERDVLKKQIDTMDTVDDEVDYLVNTAPILFKYYDILEKGSGDEIVAPKIAGNSILKWLVKPQECEKKEEVEKEDRASLLERYMSLTEDNFIKAAEPSTGPTETTQWQCQNCGSMSMNVILNDGIIYCNDCACVEYIIVDHDRPSYKDPPKEISYFAYKRINHFNEWLSQIQGKETTEIPEEIYDAIVMEIKKQRITNMADLKISKIKDILKKLKYNKYYEHAAHIKHKLNGVPIPHLEPELEEKLRTMFKLIQPPFLKYMPSQRKNFLSYSYCIHKMIQLLGKDEYLPNFPLLKSRDKLHQQDQIWKNICEELGWHFIRSI